MSDILPIEQILVYGNMPSAVFYKTPVWRKVRYEALTFSKFTFGKKPEDFVFDIGGCLFPPSMYTLLADDQGCSGGRP